jgi:RimJ/RimL family protein N-acetyltransferase
VDYQITKDPLEVFFFVRSLMFIHASEGMHGLGLKKDGEMVAGVLFDGFNGTNVWMHVAAVPTKRWMTKQYLKESFSYPFDVLKAKRITGYVEASNHAARKFDEHLGFKQEAVLSGAAADGGDVIIYAMRREDCKYVA